MTDTLKGSAMITLDVYSDPVCPWCLIGKAWLDRALQSRPDHPFRISWLPFQLNPDLPRTGADRRAYLEAKFGGKEAAVQVYSKIMQAATDAGVQIHLDRITRQPNTLNAHRLIHWAGLEKCQTPMVEALMRAYFREGRDIGDTTTLAQIADGVGMDGAVVTRLLQSDADTDQIAARDLEARRRGVSAVPTFIVADSYALPGAQPVALWQEVIDDIAAQQARQ